MKTMIKQLTTAAIVFALALSIHSCKKDKDPVNPSGGTPPPDEAELITTLKLIFTDSATSVKTAFTFADPDGEGGNAPTQFDTIMLAPSKTYYTQIILLNESVSPVDTISNEVQAENDEHLFCYTPTGANITIARIDSDGTYEVGLESKWITGLISTGTVNIILKHQPGIKDGTCSPGDTDIELDFNCKIE